MLTKSEVKWGSRGQQIPVGNYKLSDLSVVAFALVPDGEGARMDNIVEVKAGESADYQLND